MLVIADGVHMKRKIVLIIGVIIIILFIMNFNTILGIFFPKETYIEVKVEETPYIKGGIIHIAVFDNDGKSLYSKEHINVTLIDKNGNKGHAERPIYYLGEEYFVGGYGFSIHRYGGANDSAWKNLSTYGDYTIQVSYPGEMGYKPCNITKNITIHAKEVPKSQQTSSRSHPDSYTDIFVKSRNPNAYYSGEDDDYYIYTYHSNLPYGDNHIRVNKHTGEIV